MPEQRKSGGRRATDHNAPCPTLKEHLVLEEKVLVELAEIKGHLSELPGIKTKLAEVGDLLTVFKNTKGFVAVVKWAGISILGATAVGAAVTAAVAAIKAWASSPN